MPLPAPTFVLAHGVLQLAAPVPRDPARDEVFIEAVRGEFPNVLNRQILPPETPSIAPHLVLASTSSQLALSAVQADFEVRFYGEFVADIERALEYVERKMNAVLGGFMAAELEPMVIGLVSTLHFSFGSNPEERPAAHVLSTHLRSNVEASDVQDALARVSVRLRDTYFVTLTLSNYESRIFERPLMPGLVPQLPIRPWEEGRVSDVGLELVIDINNFLEVREQAEHPVVTEQGVAAVTRLLRQISTTSGPEFAETGELSVEEMTVTSQL